MAGGEAGWFSETEQRSLPVQAETMTSVKKSAALLRDFPSATESALKTYQV
jgi:hypothetical protein